MTKDNYEVLVDTAIQSATVLDHSKSPCEENFIPETKVRKTYMYWEKSAVLSYFGNRNVCY